MVPKRPLDEKLESVMLATNVWAPDQLPNEIRHVPLNHGVYPLFSGRWNMRTRRL